MLNPAIGKLLNEYDSRYSLVIATSKRARQITDEYEQNEEILTEKAVNLAMNEMSDHKFTIEEVL